MHCLLMCHAIYIQSLRTQRALEGFFKLSSAESGSLPQPLCPAPKDLSLDKQDFQLLLLSSPCGHQTTGMQVLDTKKRGRVSSTSQDPLACRTPLVLRTSGETPVQTACIQCLCRQPTEAQMRTMSQCIRKSSHETA